MPKTSVFPEIPAAVQTTEALIVGGGPAGLAASIALRQRGIECTVVEARARAVPGTEGIDKACGEGLMPDSRELLLKLGVDLIEADGHLFHGIRFANARHSVEACFPNGSGIGVRRPRLHSLLTQRAEQVGARLLFGHRIQLAEQTTPDVDGYHTALVNGEPIRFRWLIGADGQASSVRRWAGLDPTKKHSLRYGFRTHYRVAPWSPYVEVHWGKHGQLYITPVAADCVCVVYITRDPHCDRHNLLAGFPEVAARLAGAEAAGPQRGAVTATRRLQSVATESVALIGDASGSADAITGEGLAISFRQAFALADSIASGSLDHYRGRHASLSRLPHSMASLMLLMDRWPALQLRSLKSLAKAPKGFDELLQAHMGQRKLPAVLLRRAPGFGLRLLSARAGA